MLIIRNLPTSIWILSDCDSPVNVEHASTQTKALSIGRSEIPHTQTHLTFSNPLHTFFSKWLRLLSPALASSPSLPAWCHHDAMLACPLRYALTGHFRYSWLQLSSVAQTSVGVLVEVLARSDHKYSRVNTPMPCVCLELTSVPLVCSTVRRRGRSTYFHSLSRLWKCFPKPGAASGANENYMSFSVKAYTTRISLKY